MKSGVPSAISASLLSICCMSLNSRQSPGFATPRTGSMPRSRNHAVRDVTRLPSTEACETKTRGLRHMTRAFAVTEPKDQRRGDQDRDPEEVEAKKQRA